jgi:hypothetical protein
LSGQHEPLYRLEHLVTKRDVIKLRELAIAHGVSFPEFVENVFQVGLGEVEILGIGDVPSSLRQFVAWLEAQGGTIVPPPVRCARLVQEMFLLWVPVRQKDLEEGVRGVEDAKARELRRKALAWWYEYCDTYKISPTLLVDGGARW